MTARPTGEPDLRVLMTCLARSYLVGANFNTRGMQNIGLIYAMDPGLRAIHAAPAELKAARKRYLPHYNTHPFWTPLLIGVFLSLEMSIAKKKLPPDALANVRETTTYTLSAIGDSVFGGGVMVMWALLTACLIVSGHGASAVVMGCGLLAGLQAFKAATFFLGVREGFSFLPRLKKLSLIDWGRRVKMANAGLIVLFWYLIWPKPIIWQGWLVGIGSLWLLAWLALRTPLTRIAALLLLMAGYAFLPHVTAW